MAAFMRPDETLEIARRAGVAAVIDDLRPPRGAIMPRLGKKSPWVIEARLVDLLHGLTLAGLGVHAIAGGVGAWRIGQGRIRQKR